MTIKDLINRAGTTIAQRGRRYWKDGRVMLTSKDNDMYMATVRGTKEYAVSVIVKGDEVNSFFCDCPYGALCKHVVAVLLEIEHMKDVEEPRQRVPEIQEAEEIVDFCGKEITQKELFFLCYMAYVGDIERCSIGYVPVKISRDWRFTQKEQQSVLARLKKLELVCQVASSDYYYQPFTYYVHYRYYLDVLKELIQNRSQWLEFFRSKRERNTMATYLMTLTEGLVWNVSVNLSWKFYYDSDEQCYLCDVLAAALLTEEGDRIFGMLDAIAKFKVMQQMLQNVLEGTEIHYLPILERCLDGFEDKSSLWYSTFLHYRMAKFYVTGQLEELPRTKYVNESLYYTQGVELLYEGKSGEAIRAFQKGLREAKGRGAWKYVPSDVVSFLCYVMALGMHRDRKDVQMLRNLVILKKEGLSDSLKPVFVLVNYFQSNLQPKETTLLLNILKQGKESPNTLAVAALILHFFGAGDRFNKTLPLSQVALLQNELSVYGLCEKGNWPYAPLLSTIKPRDFWELELEELLSSVGMSRRKAKTQEVVEQNGRLCYVTDKYMVKEVREQNRLKSGAWGKGKRLSYVRFEQCNALTDDLDRKIHEAWRKKVGRHARINSQYPSHELLLPFLKGTDKLFFNDRNLTPISIREEKPFLYTEHKDDQIVFGCNVPEQVVEYATMVIDQSVPNEWVYYPIDIKARETMKRLLALGRVPVEAEPMLEQLFEALLGQVEIHSDIAGGMELEKIEGETRLTLRILPEGTSFRLTLCLFPLEGGARNVFPGRGEASIFDNAQGGRVEVVRDLKTEKRKLKQLNTLFDEELQIGRFYADQPSLLLSALQVLDLLDVAPENESLFVLEWPEGGMLKLIKPKASTWEIQAQAQGGWFELEGEIPLTEDHVLGMAQLLNLLRNSEGGYVRLGQDEYVRLSDSLRRQLQRIDAVAQLQAGKVRIPELAMAVSGDALQGELEIAEPEQLCEMRRKIRQSEKMEVQIPDSLNATLRDYQEDGVRWMMRLMHWGAGVCLADDMGLGKTLQTIACLLAHSAEGGQMVVAPASVVSNWLREVNRFAPSLNVVMLNELVAGGREQIIASIGAGSLLVLTYGLLVSEREALTSRRWVSVCLDEAHTIKNRDTKSSAAAMQLQATNRIILTGTPIQNHLGELWNLMQFINPGLLGSYEHFTERFITPIAAGEQDPKQQLKRMIAPFMLRRTKQEVARELPDKEEIQVPVTLSKDEMAIYEVIRREAKDELENAAALSVNALAMITKLREAACSAALVEKGWKGTSSKLGVMTDKLQQMVEQGNRVLVFSQFTSFLDMACKALEEVGITDYFYLNGSIPLKKRQQMVEAFQKGEKHVFLISLKAGGLGLNLTGANYVIHLDPWWNPAIEQQATDRAYRIGQQQKVTVYHFIAEHTIEEKILRLHHTKRSLADSLLEGTDMSHKLTAKDLLELLG